MASNEKWDAMAIETGCMKLECCFGRCCAAFSSRKWVHSLQPHLSLDRNIPEARVSSIIILSCCWTYCNSICLYTTFVLESQRRLRLLLCNRSNLGSLVLN
uniref:Uncharacterized protein n=1 Tax=Physcomitrium patens TaxID=3218 RepID=A0A2K1J6L3_PHYPA|nr:hypothetical protein PHYPA_020268 [Physcomitrium patens]